MLLVLASILIQTFVRLLNVDTGFQAEGVLTMEVALPRAVDQGQRPAEFFEGPGAGLSAVPRRPDRRRRVERVARFEVSAPGHNRWTTETGTRKGSHRRLPRRHHRLLPGDGHPACRRQRQLPRLPAAGIPPVLLINSMMADSVFPGESAIGRPIKLTSFDQNAPWYTVVGIVGDTRHTALDGPVRQQVYLHHNVEPSARGTSAWCSGRGMTRRAMRQWHAQRFAGWTITSLRAGSVR